jgi:hypothetical protein
LQAGGEILAQSSLLPAKLRGYDGRQVGRWYDRQPFVATFRKTWSWERARGH